MPFVERVRDFDDAAARTVDQLRTPSLDRVMYGLSSAADHGLLWLGIAAGRAARRRRPAIALRMTAILGTESALTNGVIKTLFRRVRPPEELPVDAPLPYGMHRPLTSAFPSGHAATAFTAATVLAPSSALPAPAWYALAALVAGSRVYVRMHHTSDVLAGAALGVVLGSVARRLLPLEA
jgi:undecaprenyl-diphosphatase